MSKIDEAGRERTLLEHGIQDYLDKVSFSMARNLALFVNLPEETIKNYLLADLPDEFLSVVKKNPEIWWLFHNANLFISDENKFDHSNVEEKRKGKERAFEQQPVFLTKTALMCFKANLVAWQGSNSGKSLHNVARQYITLGVIDMLRIKYDIGFDPLSKRMIQEVDPVRWQEYNKNWGSNRKIKGTAEMAEEVIKHRLRLGGIWTEARDEAERVEQMVKGGADLDLEKMREEAEQMHDLFQNKNLLDKITDWAVDGAPCVK